MLIKRFTFYLIIALAFVTGLNEVGLNLSVVMGAAGIASVAIGFASQTSMSNLISGIFMIVERPFMVGDVIRVGATTGEVSSMGLLSTILKSADNIMIRIPNENLMKSEIANLTRFNVRKVDVNISVDYSADLEKVRAVLMQAVEGVSGVLKDPGPQVTFKGFTDVSMQVILSAWTSSDNVKDLSYNLPAIAKNALDHGKISFPVSLRGRV
jgi:small-conductance mechanosensitive channel